MPQLHPYNDKSSNPIDVPQEIADWINALIRQKDACEKEADKAIGLRESLKSALNRLNQKESEIEFLKDDLTKFEKMKALVIEVRKLQRAYFNGDKSVLSKAKAMEADLDRRLDMPIEKKALQQQLFR